jgi:short-subunit dehydrogenase
MPAIENKVVAIAGASSGIGAALAVDLARRGARLVLAARRTDKLAQVSAQCLAAGAAAAHVVTLTCDVARRADVDRLVAHAVSAFGRLDVMVANAGYGMLAKIHEMTEAEFDEIFATNVKGTWYAMQAAAEAMLKQQPTAGEKWRGHIIAVSSGAARRGLPLYGAYSMTKAAQLSLAEAMRVELRRQRIYVSTVHPLTTRTEFFDVATSKSRMRSSGLGRAQTAEAVARKITGLIRRPRPELWPAFLSRYLLVLAALSPRLGDWSMARTVGRRTR